MSTGHQLPPELGADDGDDHRDRPAAPPAPEPSHAERARTLVAQQNRGVLSTVCLDPPGYPFGSVATYALDDRGRPLIFVSTMAEHTRNAAADPRASLIVTEPVADGSDPLAAGRVTLVGDLVEVGAEERPAVRDRYLAENPASAYYIDFGDFSFWRLEVRSVRYVGGYGRMSWVEADGYATAESDPLAPVAVGVLEHMNADHAEALVLMARAFAGQDGATEAVMTAVDRYGFDVVASGPGGRAAVRIGWGTVVDDPDDVRPEMVRLVREAREKAGAS